MIQRGRPTPIDTDRHTVPPDRRPLSEQPKWRRDFPIDVPQDEYVARRDLVKFLVLTSAAFSVGQVWIVLKSLFDRRASATPAVAVADVDELPVGGAKTFIYPEGSTPRLLVRKGEDAYRAAGLSAASPDAAVLDAIAKEPILLERPIAVRGERAVVLTTPRSP